MRRNKAAVYRAAMCSAAIALGALGAGASEPEPFKVTVSYRAPASCPRMSDFMTRLAGYLEGGGEAPLYAIIEISEADSKYHLKVTIYVAALPLRREESLASCDELVRVAALMTAMARAEPERSEAPGGEGDPEPAMPEPEPGVIEPEAEHVPQSDSPPPPPEAATAGRGARWLVGAEVQSGVGLLPGVAWGTGALLSVAWQSFGLRALASFWLPSSVASPAGVDSLPPLSLALQSLDLGACLRHSLHDAAAYELGLSACAVLSGYRLAAEARQFGQASDVTYRAAAGFSAGASLELPGALELGLQLALADLVKPFRVYAAPLQGPLYESASNHLRVELMMGFRFEGGGGG